MELKDQTGRAEVIDITKLPGGSVKFGATVTLVGEDTDEKRKYQIVGDVESDAKRGRISLSSPIARALIGKGKGDTVEGPPPGATRACEVLKVDFVWAPLSPKTPSSPGLAGRPNFFPRK